MLPSVNAWRLSQLLWSGLLLGLFGALGAAVAAIPLLGAVDLTVVVDLHRVAVEPFVEKSRELTLLGGTAWILGLTAATVGLLAAFRSRKEAVAIAVAVASTEIGVALVKGLMLRQRPPAADAVDHAAGYSFPSGHAAASLALFASLACLLSRRQPLRVRIAVWVATAGLLLGIGLTRIYLGVHYPTDIAAGWLLAGALTMAAWGLLGPAPRRFAPAAAVRRLRAARTGS